jgi:hypothetical protein
MTDSVMRRYLSGFPNLAAAVERRGCRYHLKGVKVLLLDGTGPYLIAHTWWGKGEKLHLCIYPSSGPGPEGPTCADPEHHGVYVDGELRGFVCPLSSDGCHHVEYPPGTIEDIEAHHLLLAGRWPKTGGIVIA